MRNFYDQPTNKIFDKMFGKGARQIQADPATDLTKCKCCQCDKVECKGCMEGHIITPSAGCCPSKNEALIFEYERPFWPAPEGPECCPGNHLCCNPEFPAESCGSICFDDQGRRTCPFCVGQPGVDYRFFPGEGYRQLTPVTRCCNSAKLEETNVRFYYNYIGKYFKINYEATGKYAGGRRGITPRNCSYCDPTTHDETIGGAGNPYYDRIESCVDFRTDSQPGGMEGDELCTAREGEISWKNCQCMGAGQRRDRRRGPDPGERGKRLSKYRKRQMEKDPYYMWLLDIMCYDQGNIQFNPAQEYYTEPGLDYAIVQENYNGTLYDHLVGVVHCEHWYEQATCRDLNPEHGDPNGIVGGWLMDPMNPDIPVGYNTSKLAPRFWIYACSGVPLFDFEIQDALDREYITEADKAKIHFYFARKLTPPQELMKKLAKGGYLDVGDWRQEALSEIRELRGNTYTAAAYGGIINGDPNFGACCLNGASGSTCLDGVSAAFCQFTGGNFFPASRCNDAFCSSQFCSSFKYLGPVRKKWAVANSLILADPPRYPDPIFGEPSISNPKKARPNIISGAPSEALREDFPTGKVLPSLQLPDALIQDPWKGGSYPSPPAPGQPRSEEYKAFEMWRDKQWVYMHARPGGWSYVCPGYGWGAEGETLDILRDLRIPDLFRAVGNGSLGGCLEGVMGIPQRNGPIQACPIPPGFCEICQDEEVGFDENGNPIIQEVCTQNPRIECLEAGGPACVGLECAGSQLCGAYYEMGGGGTPCSNLAIKSNCDGIRFMYFTQRFQITSGVQGYYECARTINSYLYKVNVTTGNYGQFCPHMCRNLEIPKQIANAVPSLFSNARAHEKLCDQISRNMEASGNPPDDTLGQDMCPSSYCFASGYNTFSESCKPGIGIYYGPECQCCEKRINGPVHSSPVSSNYTHRAANKEDCPFYPGQGYPEIYDGQFLGRVAEWNPEGCCWKCKLEDGIPVADEYRGIERYYHCWDLQPEAIKSFDNFANSGRGFIYFDSIDSSTVDCPTPWAGECACGTNSPDNVPPASSGEFCDPNDGGGGPPPPPPPPGPP